MWTIGGRVKSFISDSLNLEFLGSFDADSYVIIFYFHEREYHVIPNLNNFIEVDVHDKSAYGILHL